MPPALSTCLVFRMVMTAPVQFVGREKLHADDEGFTNKATTAKSSSPLRQAKIHSKWALLRHVKTHSN